MTWSGREGVYRVKDDTGAPVGRVWPYNRQWFAGRRDSGILGPYANKGSAIDALTEGEPSMETTASEMTVDHLGDGATGQDLEDFRRYVKRAQDKLQVSEQEATDRVWGDGGDYIRNARRLGVYWS